MGTIIPETIQFNRLAVHAFGQGVVGDAHIKAAHLNCSWWTMNGQRATLDIPLLFEEEQEILEVVKRAQNRALAQIEQDSRIKPNDKFEEE